MRLDALLRFHANAARQSVATVQPPALGRRAAHRSRRFSVGLATLIIAAATATFVVSLLTDQQDSSTNSTVDLAPTTTLLPVWPPVLDVVAPEGASWPCPSVEPKTDQVLEPEEVPAEIRYLPPADAYEIDEAFGVDYGPACMRAPALVAVDFGEGDRSSIDAVVVVWVEAPDAVTGPPDDPPMGPTITNPVTETLGVTVDTDGFVVRYRPPTGLVTERVDMVGTIDGLPVWIESSGLSPETLSGLVALLSASPTTGEVTFSQPASSEGGFEVVRSGPVTAEVIENVVWFVGGTGFDIQVQRAPGFDPYASALGFTDSIVFVDIDGGVGMQVREGGGTGSVQWAIQPGVFARVEGDGTFDELVSFAEQLLPEVESGDEVTATTRNQYMFECLVGRGFGAVVEIVDGMVFAHPAPDQVAAFDAADVECMNLMQQELGPPPTVDPAEFYAQLLATAECLLREGYHPAPAPTLEEFLAQWENPSDESFPWHPYEAVNPGREEWLRINSVCPQP